MELLRPSTRELARAARSMGLLQSGSIGLTFLIGVLLAHSLGAAGYGTYALAMAIVSLAGMMTEFGLPTLVVREASSTMARDSWSDLAGLLRWSDWLVLVSSGVIIAAFYLAIWLANLPRSDFVVTLGWAILLIPAVAIGKLRAGALLAFGKTAASQFPILILRPALFAGGIAVLITLMHVTMRPQIAMRVNIASASLAMALAILLLRRVRPAPLASATPAYAKRAWISAAFPMAMTEGLRAAQGQLAIFFIGLLTTVTAVGLYRVADATSAMCMLPVTLLNVIASPMIARLHSLKDRDELQHVLSGVALAMTAGVAILAMPLLIAGRMLLGLAFGHQFEAANSTLIILVLGYAAATALGPVAIYMNMTGRERHVTRTCAVALVVNFLVALALVPPLGSKGAAIATVGGYFTWSALLLIQIHREDRLNPTILGFWSRRHPDRDGAVSI